MVFQCQPHQILGRHMHVVLDVLAAIPYLIHFPLPILFIAYLASNSSRRKGLYSFLWLAGWVNLVAVLNQFFFPTAPVCVQVCMQMLSMHAFMCAPY